MTRHVSACGSEFNTESHQDADSHPEAESHQEAESHPEVNALELAE